MKTIPKLAALVVLLNVVRYTVGGFIEGFTIMEPMHRPLPLFPEAFDQDFSSTDFMISLGYNYAMWFVAAVVFHLLNPVLRGSIWVRSLKSYLLMAAFFCAVAAVYMNHYVEGIRPFYYWSMVDALIVFTVVALANALLYPRFFRDPAGEPVANRSRPPRSAQTRSLAPLLPLALLPACGDAGDGSATGAAGTLDGPDVVVNAVTEEVFTAGSVEGDAWDTFGSVDAVGFDEEANLHILDSQAARVFMVGPDGSLMRTAGGQGEGPGEFDSPSGLIVARDGSYTVMGLMRIDLLNPTGEFVRRVALDPMMMAATMTDLALPDGRLVTRIRLGLGDDEGPGGRPIHIFPLDGTEPEVLYTAWDLPGEEEDLVETERSSGGLMMRISAGRAFEPPLARDVLTDGRLALVDSVGYRIKLIAPDGRVTGTIERPIAPLPVDEGIMAAERERYRENTASLLDFGERSALSLQFEVEGAEALRFADEVPVIADIAVDWEDRIWVLRRGPTGDDDGPTDIVTHEGGYIGTLPPDGLRTPHAFGPGGLMAYIETDELDVQTVRVVRLTALEPSP